MGVACRTAACLAVAATLPRSDVTQGQAFYDRVPIAVEQEWNSSNAAVTSSGQVRHDGRTIVRSRSQNPGRGLIGNSRSSCTCC